ncbi:hypothetical protein DD238_007639 [Peronospora effusa]|uniref:Uncharacterized protein n=1 Tax=Peronospora effusa TaxID=542832 RepID=A0A3M6VAW0_9STRA|nr:hypothetical protein DD238_007639 [Peronospora effusa]
MEDEERHVQSMPHQHLDRDPSRLTTFPMPGFLASTFQASNDDAENGDDAQTVADAAGGKKKIDENEQRLYSSESLDGNETSRKSLSGRFDRLSRRLSGEVGSTKPSPLIFGPSADPIEGPMLSLSPIDSNTSDVTGLDQLTDVACLTTEPIDLCEESDNVDTRRNFRPQVRTRIRHSSAELLGAIENGRLDTEVLAFHNWVKNVSADNEVSTVSEKTAREINTRNSNNLYTQRDIALDKHMVRKRKIDDSNHC